MSADYVIPAAPQATIAVAGTTKTFPVRRIWCVGRNYIEHIREMGQDERLPPFYFAKPADAPDAAHGKRFGRAGDGDGRLRGRRNHVVVGHDELAVGMLRFKGKARSRDSAAGPWMASGYQVAGAAVNGPRVVAQP